MAGHDLDCLTVGGRVFDPLHDVTWSQEALSVADLWQRYQSRVPFIVRVCQGYSSEQTQESHSRDEVVRVTSCCSQGRAVINDLSSGRGCFSIPYDHPVRVQVIDQLGIVDQEALSVGEIALKHKLPVTVQTVGALSSKVFGDTRVHKVHRFRVEDVHTEERYLVGNTLCKGCISSDVCSIPFYLPLTLCHGEGPKDPTVTLQDWQALKDKMESLTQKFSYFSFYMNKELMAYETEAGEDRDDDYDQVAPPKSHSGYRGVVKDEQTSMENLGAGTLSKSIIKMVTDRVPFVNTPVPRRRPSCPQYKAAPFDEDYQDAISLDSGQCDLGRRRSDPEASSGSHQESPPLKSPPPIKPKPQDHILEDTMSISNLGDTLRKLKLEKYVKVFEDLQINIVLLSNLTVDDLMEVAKMSNFEAQKLFLYINKRYAPNP